MFSSAPQRAADVFLHVYWSVGQVCKMWSSPIDGDRCFPSGALVGRCILMATGVLQVHGSVGQVCKM